MKKRRQINKIDFSGMSKFLKSLPAKFWKPDEKAIKGGSLEDDLKKDWTVEEAVMGSRPFFPSVGTKIRGTNKMLMIMTRYKVMNRKYNSSLFDKLQHSYRSGRIRAFDFKGRNCL